MKARFAVRVTIALGLTSAACSGGAARDDRPAAGAGGSGGGAGAGGSSAAGSSGGSMAGSAGGPAGAGQAGAPFAGSPATMGDLQIFVAPTGDDANPGTADKPVKTPAKARDLVRAATATKRPDHAVVVLRGGTYFLDQPLSLGAQDGGDATHAVTWAAYQSETPVLSGGRLVTGWTRDKGDVWKTTLPDVKSGAWWFRDLFVDGKRATRARFEVRGDGASDSNTVELREPMPIALTSTDDAEVEIHGIWFASRQPVTSASGRSLTFRTKIDGLGAVVAWVEHARGLIDEPGEWYLERATGTLYYQEEPGKDPNARTFVAGRLPQVLAVEGTANARVTNLSFHGLSFMHTTWQADPAEGYNEKWAGTYGFDEMKLRQIPLAVDVEWADGVRFEGCRVAHVGTSGIGFGRGVTKSQIVGNEIYDVAANGVVSGWRGKVNPDGTMPQDVVFNEKWFPPNEAGVDDLALPWGGEAAIPRDNEVTDNHVHHCGQVYEGTVGVHMQFQHNPRVEHNEVHDVSYAGMTFEMYKGDAQDKNVYSWNHVHDVMFLGNDGDFIYHSASIMGCRIEGNVAVGGGIYLDYHGNGNTVIGNVIDHFRLNSTEQKMMSNVENATAAQYMTAIAKAGPREPYRAALAAFKEPIVAGAR
jgi:hypothetical protein